MNAGIRKSRQWCPTVVAWQVLPLWRWHFSWSGVRRTCDLNVRDFVGRPVSRFANPWTNPDEVMTTVFGLFQDAVWIILFDAVTQTTCLSFRFLHVLFLFLLPFFQQYIVQCTCNSTHDFDIDCSFHGPRKHQPLPPCVISISCIPSLPELFTTGCDPPGVVAIHWGPRLCRVGCGRDSKETDAQSSFFLLAGWGERARGWSTKSDKRERGHAVPWVV